ncbi:MAG: alpha/beta fold hydrolase, partial [Bacteroidetes bacterium]|nr:alpha/beta fold hydrolase [Bacteroidota bacterium]
MKKYFLSFIVLVALSSCLRLDDNLYNANKLTEYKLDNYTGEVDFTLDYSYHIPDSLVHIFTLSSQGAGESNATTIYAIYIGDIAQIATDTVIMYCHGNKDHMDFYWQRAKLLANTKSKNRFGVLMIDYRGYGMSEGKPTENGLYADTDAALKWLQSKGLTNDRLVIYGFSMGSAPATKLSANNYTLKPSKLMLEAPFASAEVMVQDGAGLALPGTTVTDLQINNGEEIKSVQQPFFGYMAKPMILNIDTHGAVVYNNYQGTYKEAHRIPNAGHSTIPTT